MSPLSGASSIILRPPKHTPARGPPIHKKARGSRHRSPAMKPLVVCMLTAITAFADVDLRPEFEKLHLSPRPQGARPTCSVFAVTQALEFTIAKSQAATSRLSPEYLIWAANQVRPGKRDGGFFSELWDGFAKHGIATESSMPYQNAFNPDALPDKTASAEAAKSLALGLRTHWIKKWNVNTGLSDAEFQTLLATLTSGSPVCGGFRWPKTDTWQNGIVRMCGPEDVFDGHSLLLTGFLTDSARPGGGLLLIRDSATGQDRQMPFAYAKQFMNDAVWFGKTSPAP